VLSDNLRKRISNISQEKNSLKHYQIREFIRKTRTELRIRNISIKIVLVIMDLGVVDSEMAKEKCNGKMEHVTKEIGSLGMPMVEEFLLMHQVTPMTDNSICQWHRAMAHTQIIKVLIIRDNGNLINSMGKELKDGKIILNMKDSTLWGSSKDLESISGLRTKQNTKENGIKML